MICFAASDSKLKLTKDVAIQQLAENFASHDDEAAALVNSNW